MLDALPPVCHQGLSPEFFVVREGAGAEHPVRRPFLPQGELLLLALLLVGGLGVLVEEVDHPVPQLVVLVPPVRLLLGEVLRQVQSLELVAVQDHRDGLLGEGDALVQVEDVQHLVDGLPEVQPLLSHIPVRLEAGPPDDREESLPEPGEEAHVPRGVVVEVVLCEPHLEHEAHEEEHEEEDGEDGVEDATHEGKSREELVETPGVVGDNSTVLDLEHGRKLSGLVDEDLVDCLLSLKGIGADELSQRGQAFINGEVILIQLAAILVVLTILDQEGVLADVEGHRVHGVRGVDEGVEGVDLVVAAVDAVGRISAGHVYLQSPVVAAQLEVPSDGPGVVEGQAGPAADSPAVLLLLDVRDDREMLGGATLEGDAGFGGGSVARRRQSLNMHVKGTDDCRAVVVYASEVLEGDHVGDFPGRVLEGGDVDHRGLEADLRLRGGGYAGAPEDDDQLVDEEGDDQQDRDEGGDAAAGAGHLHLVVQAQEVGVGEEHAHLLQKCSRHPVVLNIMQQDLTKAKQIARKSSPSWLSWLLAATCPSYRSRLRPPVQDND